MRILLMLSILSFTGCSRPSNEVDRILKLEGCSNIQDNGANVIFDGCSRGDIYNNQFSCTKNGTSVEGVLCSGIFKGYTVRYF